MNRKRSLDKPAQIASTTVHSLSHDGRGIATVNQKTTFIVGALPQETVNYQVMRKRSSYHEAQTVEVLTPSPDRVQPPCQHAGLCGGCSLQHMHLSLQLQMKEKTLLDQLKHFGKVAPELVLAPLHEGSLGYRRKARLGVKFVIKKEKLLVGFREKASNYLADLERCEVLHPEIGGRLLELSSFIMTLEMYRHLPQIEVAVGDNEVALVFRHLEPMIAGDREKLIAFGVKHGFQIYLQPNPPELIHKIWPLDGPDRLTYTLPQYGLEFLFHPLDFTQINLEMNRSMVKQALELLALTAEDTVLDLFCGIGNFTLPMAKLAKKVVGVEGSAEMVKRGYDNARHNQIENVAFFAANLQDSQVASAEWASGKHYDKILLDPPRAGAIEALPLIASFGAKRIVYVSCNPATLARDAGELVHQYGYRLVQAGIMNMFPHTAHIEAMAVFEKANS
jgi:23S rRNA (uracil1939-C5)-methyltransferase